MSSSVFLRPSSVVTKPSSSISSSTSSLRNSSRSASANWTREWAIIPVQKRASSSTSGKLRLLRASSSSRKGTAAFASSASRRLATFPAHVGLRKEAAGAAAERPFSGKLQRRPKFLAAPRAEAKDGRVSPFPRRTRFQSSRTTIVPVPRVSRGSSAPGRSKNLIAMDSRLCDRFLLGSARRRRRSAQFSAQY